MRNHSYDIYRNLSLLLAHGISISDILHCMKINEIYLYGIGEMGELFLSALSDEIKVLAIFDRDCKKQGIKKIWNKSGRNCMSESMYCEYQVYPVEELPKDERTILVTPASGYFEIVSELSERGISRSRFLSFNLLLYYGIHYMSNLISGCPYYMGDGRPKEFLITGAQFGNKGAQNMLFVTVSEIRKRYADAIIWYLPNYWENEYQTAWREYRILILKDETDPDSTLHEIFSRLDALVDISGTAWAVRNGLQRNINFFRMACEYEVPVYFMPQSFASAAFDAETEKEQKNILAHAKVIYVREKDGYRFLTDTLGLTNVKLSEDLVLQNTCLEEEYIFVDKENHFEGYRLQTKHNVAVIPNTQNYRYGNPEIVHKLYQDIIRELLVLGKEVYIISHSEDEVICKGIYETFKKEDNVHYYEKKFDCIGFRKLIRNFEYAVASRFHAIVNAYKESVPCVVIGWLEKYRELTDKMQQSRYLFDVRDYMNTEEIIGAVAAMEKRWIQESEIISRTLPELQKENCFDVLNDMD